MASPPAAGSAPIISVENLRKIYRTGLTGRRQVEALRGVSLAIRPGEVFGLLGPNGAGKTTLVKVLLGIVRRSGGSATVMGQPAGSVESRRRIGYLPENLHVERHHTARTALRFYGRLSNMSAAELDKRTDALLEMVGLRGRDREPVRQFSKGMNQRLGLAQALLHDPDLLILDEPTDGLDPVGRSDVRQLLRRLGDEGKSVMMNSHILQEVELVCDRVAIMTHGVLRSVGSIDEITEASKFGQLVLHVSPAQADQALTVLGSLEGLGVPVARPAAGRDAVPIDIEVVDQAQTDRCVDALRQVQISIRRLEIERPSLEDIFLSTVRTHASPDHPSP